jgi:hypothetical protein
MIKKGSYVKFKDAKKFVLHFLSTREKRSDLIEIAVLKDLLKISENRNYRVITRGNIESGVAIQSGLRYFVVPNKFLELVPLAE